MSTQAAGARRAWSWAGLRTRSAAADAEAVRPAEPVTGPAVPTGLAIGIGAVAMVAAGMVAAAIPTAYPGWRFGVVAAAVGMFAAVSLDQVALAAVAVIGFMISNGFLEDRFGQLAWHGSADMWRLMLLVIAGAWGLAAGEAYRYISRMREGKHGA